MSTVRHSGGRVVIWSCFAATGPGHMVAVILELLCIRKCFRAVLVFVATFDLVLDTFELKSYCLSHNSGI